MSVSKISTQTSTKWGPLDLSQPIGTILPAGVYNATIAEVKVLDGDESLRMIVTFEIQADNGEFVSPEPSWLTVAALPNSKAQTQIREGLRDLKKLTWAAGVQDGMTDWNDIAEALLGKKLRVNVSIKGSGVNTINRVTKFDQDA